jgi:hypothetical protein
MDCGKSTKKGRGGRRQAGKALKTRCRAEVRPLQNREKGEFFRSLLEPIAAIGDPPTHDANGNGCRHCPPKWQDEISQQAQAGESDPKDLSLHSLILARMYREEAAVPKNHDSCLRRGEATVVQPQPFCEERKKMGRPSVALPSRVGRALMASRCSEMD